MRSILGIGVVLAAAGLTAAVGTAYGQTRAGGQAGRGASGIGGRAASTAVNEVEQQVTGGATNTAVPGQAVPTPPQAGAGATPTNTVVPGQVVTTPPQPAAGAATTAVPGQVVPTPPQPAAGAVTTTPPNTYQAPGTTGSVLNPAGTATAYPGNTATGTVNAATAYPAGTAYPPATNPTTYSSNYYAPGYQQGTYPGPGTAATPGYTGQVMPGMAGYNSVNPMGTTMAPSYYYAGTAGTPYVTGATTGYYTGQPQTYAAQPRRGLFGGMFRRRNRVAYPASPYGSTYGTTPYGYTTTGYTTYTTPGTYSYSTSPY